MHHPFCTFVSCRQHTTTKWNCLISLLVLWRTRTNDGEFLFLLFILNVVSKKLIINYAKIRPHLTRKTLKLEWTKTWRFLCRRRSGSLITASLWFATFSRSAATQPFCTLETRRELEPIYVPQLFLGGFLGSLVGTRQSAIGQLFFLLCLYQQSQKPLRKLTRPRFLLVSKVANFGSWKKSDQELSSSVPSDYPRPRSSWTGFQI